MILSTRRVTQKIQRKDFQRLNKAMTSHLSTLPRAITEVLGTVVHILVKDVCQRTGRKTNI